MQKINIIISKMVHNCSKCHNSVEELASGKTYCKPCKNKYEKDRKAKLSVDKKEEINKKERDRYVKKKKLIQEKEEVLEFDTTQTKKCTCCGKNRTLDMFYLAKCKGTLRAECTICSSVSRKQHYQDNREKIVNQTAKYISDKMKTNPTFKLERRLRNRLYQAFVSQGCTKSHRTWKYIDCTPEFFREWMEYQLYDGMTMQNYGKIWHIDHVKPCSSFDLTKTEDIAKCFHWTNLQPLLASKNYKKYTKISIYDIVLQELKVKCFKKEKGMK